MKSKISSVRAVLILSASAAVLFACASKRVPPPEISYDAA
ncbi:MAG: P-type conjugative transfer protein TrbG, partial [Mesorhizobium sp.]